MDTFINHKKGETFCGDRFLTLKKDNNTFYVVIDGIGHGQKASNVADIAYHSITHGITANATFLDIIQTCENSINF